MEFWTGNQEVIRPQRTHQRCAEVVCSAISSIGQQLDTLRQDEAEGYLDLIIQAAGEAGRRKGQLRTEKRSESTSLFYNVMHVQEQL